MQKRASKNPKNKESTPDTIDDTYLLTFATCKIRKRKKNIELLKATIPKSTLNPVDGHSPRRVLEDSMKKK